MNLPRPLRASGLIALLTLGIFGCSHLKSPVQGVDPAVDIPDTTWATAKALYDSKNYVAAIPFFLAITDTSSHYADAGYYGGRSYYETAAADSTWAMLYDSALALFMRPAVLADTGWFDNAAYYGGRSQYELKRFSPAIDRFHLVPPTSSYAADARFYIGRSFQALGQTDSAAVYLGSDVAYYAAAKALYDAQNYAGALPLFRSISENSANYINAGYYGGRCYYEIASVDPAQSSFYDSAVVLLTRPGVLADSHWFDNARYYAARSCYELGLWQSALDLFAGAGTYADDIDYYRGRCFYNRAADDSTQAVLYESAAVVLVAFRMAHPTSGYSDNAAYYAGRARYEQGNWRAALDLFAYAGSSSSLVDYYAGTSYYNLADSLRLDLFDSARVDYDRFTAAQGQSSLADNAAYYAGLCFYHKDDYPQAAARFSAFGTAYPQSGYRDNALNWLIHARTKQGDCPGALVALNELKALAVADAALVADADAYYARHCP